MDFIGYFKEYVGKKREKILFKLYGFYMVLDLGKIIWDNGKVEMLNIFNIKGFLKSIVIDLLCFKIKIYNEVFIGEIIICDLCFKII